MEDIKSRFEKMFTYIAFGLQEKLRRPNPEEYKYGLLLRQGINMFSALAVEYSGIKNEELKEYLMSLNETDMLCKKFTRPVNEWFEGWDKSFIQKLHGYLFYDIGPIIRVNETERSYELTEECYDYLDSVETDLTAIDEHRVFELIKQISQNNQDYYVRIRKFIIEHPLLTELDRKKFLLDFNNEPLVLKLVDCAYEETPEETYHCTNCGWTLIFKGLQPVCCHKDCTQVRIIKDNCKKVETEYVYRLKKGVMRYISYPGKAELEIADICKESNITFELWPEFDRYDIKIIFPNGNCWGIDAKTYSNPHFLSKSIKNDSYFKNANIDKGYYVIPDKIVKRTSGYLKICNAVITDKKFKCITLSGLKKLIKQESSK